MNPELLTAVKERIGLGHSKEAIFAALEAAGYNHDQIDAVYAEAEAEHARTAIPLADESTDKQFTPADSAVLPSGTSLFKEGWSFMLSRLDVVLWLAAPLVAITLLSYVLANPDNIFSAPAMLAAGLGLVISVIVYLLALLALLRVVTAEGYKVELKDAVSWAKSHFLGLLWIYLLTMFVVWGGFVLFIVPGIIVSLYVYCAQYVFAKEDTRGMAAILRSVQLVKGNWWALAGRTIVLILWSLLLFIPVSIVAGVLFGNDTFSDTMSLQGALGESLIQIASAVITVVMTHAGYKIYQSFAAARPVGSTDMQPDAWKYKVLAGIGVLGLLSMVLLVATLSTYQDVLSETAALESESELDLEAAKERLRNLEAAIEEAQ